MRLFRAELAKLRRPLTYCIAAVAVVASVMFAWQGVKNASNQRPTSAATPAPTCADFQLPPGALCDRAVSVQEQILAYQRQRAATRPDTRHDARPSDALPVEQPLAAGKLALGFMASLPGALLVFLLAAAHVGNEWNGRTIKAVLCQEGRRGRVLSAKFASLWAVALALAALDWACLAALSPILKAAYPLGGPGLSWSSAWSAVAADAARTPLVLAVFCVLGLTAGVVVRNALGAFVVAGGAVLSSLVVAGNFSAVAPRTIAWWVAGWMQFRPHGFVIYHFWVDGFPAGLHPPGAVTGFIGLAGVTAVAALAAVGVFRRIDITA
jgi:ABC-type transport system involved in multi-copper enzyme maturation permease subunit